MEQLNKIEQSKAPTMVFKLNEKELSSIQGKKTSVKLTSSVFHKTAAGALNYYAHHEYTQFRRSCLYKNHSRFIRQHEISKVLIRENAKERKTEI